MTTAKKGRRKASNGNSARAQPAEFRSRDEWLAAGKALRETLPRERHADWKLSAKGRGPIDILEESNRDRLPEVVVEEDL
jgi:hypothetical protein